MHFFSRRSVLGSLGLSESEAQLDRHPQTALVDISVTPASANPGEFEHQVSTGSSSASSTDSWANVVNVVPTSGLSCCQKARLPLGAFGYMVVLSSLFSQPAVYISVFGTNPSVVGAVNIVITIYDIFNTPFFGRMSDEGRFNVLCFRNLDSWGRRAPMALFSGVPMALGFWFNWVGPENFDNQIVLGLWFFMVRFLLATALGGMFETANAAAFSELFPNSKERVNMATIKGITTGIGIIIGAGVLSSLAIGIKDPAGSAKQRIVYYGIAIVSMISIASIIPWCVLMRKSLMTEATRKESMFDIIKAVWRSGNSVRVLALSVHLFSAAGSIAIPLLPFFLRQCFDYSVEQAAVGQGLIVATFSLLYVIGFPLAGCLNHRFHPVKVNFWFGLLSDFLLVAFILLARELKERVPISILCLVIAFGVKGMASASVALGRQVLSSWVIDEDQVVQTRKRNELAIATGNDLAAEVRRDGVFTAFILTSMAIGRLWAGFCLWLIGFLGYEADRDKDNIPQPEQVRQWIFMIVTVATPAFSFLSYVTLLLGFPLVGEKLHLVEKDYAALFELKTITKNVESNTASAQDVAKATRRLSQRLSQSQDVEEEITRQRESVASAASMVSKGARRLSNFGSRLSTDTIGKTANSSNADLLPLSQSTSFRKAPSTLAVVPVDE